MILAVANLGPQAGVTAQNPTIYPCVLSGTDPESGSWHCASVYDVGGGDVLAMREECDEFAGFPCTILFTDGNLDLGGIVYDGCASPHHGDFNRDWPHCTSAWSYETFYLNDSMFGSDIGGFYCYDVSGDGDCGDPDEGEDGFGFCAEGEALVPSFVDSIYYWVDGPLFQASDCLGTSNPVGGTTGSLQIWLTPIPFPTCADDIDNDGNGVADWPYDLACTKPSDSLESGGAAPAQCWDGLDNDGQGGSDGSDPGCSSRLDNDESDDPDCGDGVDNDGDSWVDVDDPDCFDMRDASENDGPQAQCSDGTDNDGDAAVDFSDPECSSPSDNDEGMPPSAGPPAGPGSSQATAHCDALHGTGPTNGWQAIRCQTSGRTVSDCSGAGWTLNTFFTDSGGTSAEIRLSCGSIKRIGCANISCPKSGGGWDGSILCEARIVASVSTTWYANCTDPPYIGPAAAPQGLPRVE